MNCYICEAQTTGYFSKRFDCFGIDTVDYQRCPRCGTVFARTLLELSEMQWQSVCEQYHGSYRGSGNNPNDPNWQLRLQQQADVLLILAERGVVSSQGPWLDHGCGEGELAGMLEARLGRIARYDRYWHGHDYLEESALIPGHFSVVISTSTLEHLHSRAGMDELAGLVADDGCLALHTLVRGEIPCDPDWFYLLPVHTIFYTNRGMARLFEQWGFSSSLYVVEARLWVWFRKPLKTLLEALGDLISLPGWHATEGFLAYWP
jgi:hypothetical protein